MTEADRLCTATIRPTLLAGPVASFSATDLKANSMSGLIAAVFSRLVLSFPIASIARSTTDDSEQLQEIIVTAQKRNEDVQKVPMSITPISEDTLEKEGAHDFEEVLTQVPNLSFAYGITAEGMSASRGIAIRGISWMNTTSF